MHLDPSRYNRCNLLLVAIAARHSNHMTHSAYHRRRLHSAASRPLLARPFVNIWIPSETSPPDWMSDELKRFAKVLFSKTIVAHPAISAYTVNKLPNPKCPQVSKLNLFLAVWVTNLVIIALYFPSYRDNNPIQRSLSLFVAGCCHRAVQCRKIHVD